MSMLRHNLVDKLIPNKEIIRKFLTPDTSDYVNVSFNDKSTALVNLSFDYAPNQRGRKSMKLRNFPHIDLSSASKDTKRINKSLSI